MKSSNTFWNDANEESSHRESEKNQSPLEFPNAEDILRHDASMTNVPPNIARRLQKSIADVPPKPAPWWRRLFG